MDSPWQAPVAPRLLARWGVRLLAGLLVVTGLLMMLTATGRAQDGGAIHVVTISGVIDEGLVPYLDRALDQAQASEAAAVLLVIDTPGGRLDSVLQMRDSLLDSDLRTISFVDRSAFSAGALIALASQEIYLAPGASMGAATPVDAGTGVPADQKVISAVRSTFRATAQERGRDPLVAEAMVDPAVQVDGLVDEGSLLTLTPDQALDVGYSEGTIVDRPAVLEAAGLDDHEVVEVDLALAERLVRFLTNPVLGSLLLTLGVLLIIGELLAGAFGLSAALGLGFLGIFFYGHLLAGLAGWEDAVLVGIGVLLILLEIFVVPGFGVPGVLGLAGVLGGGFLAMTGRDFDFVSGAQIATTATTIAVTFVLVTIALIVVLTVLGRSGYRARGRPRSSSARAPTGGAGQRRGWLRWFGDGGVLDSEDDDQPATLGSPEVNTPPGGGTAEAPSDPAKQPPPETPSTARSASREGAVGTALSDLRPAGVADFGGHRVDVVTEGDYLAAGDRVEVIRAERYRRVVRKARD